MIGSMSRSLHLVIQRISITDFWNPGLSSNNGINPIEHDIDTRQLAPLDIHDMFSAKASSYSRCRNICSTSTCSIDYIVPYTFLSLIQNPIFPSPVLYRFWRNSNIIAYILLKKRSSTYWACGVLSQPLINAFYMKRVLTHWEEL